MDPKEARRNDRYAQLALAAAHHAPQDSGLTRDDLVPDRTGVIVGSGIGGDGDNREADDSPHPAGTPTRVTLYDSLPYCQYCRRNHRD